MSTIRIGLHRMSSMGEPTHGQVLVLFTSDIHRFDSPLTPDMLTAHKVYMPVAMWQAILELAAVEKVADDVNKRVMSMDMNNESEPFATISDVRGKVVNFVYKMGLRVTP